MKKEIITKGDEHTCLGGAICGGVISQSLFDSDPWAYMMSYYMRDEDFAVYKTITDNKEKNEFFNNHAKSAI